MDEEKIKGVKDEEKFFQMEVGTEAYWLNVILLIGYLVLVASIASVWLGLII